MNGSSDTSINLAEALGFTSEEFLTTFEVTELNERIAAQLALTAEESRLKRTKSMQDFFGEFNERILH